MASSSNMEPNNWEIWNQLRDKNALMADVLGFMVSKLTDSTWTTFKELGNELTKVVKFEKDKELGPMETRLGRLMSATAAESFVRFVLKDEQHTGVYSKPHLMHRAEKFIKLTTWARNTIGTLGQTPIVTMKRDYSIILVHGSSTIFSAVLEHAPATLKRLKMEKTFRVFCTEGVPHDTTRLQHFADLAKRLAIPDQFLPQQTVTSIMEVEMVFIEPFLVDANGGIISEIGTSQIVIAANHAGKSVYVLAEGHKLSEDVLEVEARTQNWDYTQPMYLSKIFSNGGAILPSDVRGQRGEVQKLYEGF